MSSAQAHHLTVRRTARYYSSGAGEAPVSRVWVALHGHAMLAQRFLGFLEPLNSPGTLVLAPEALSRFYLGTRQDGQHDAAIGATWLTREDRDAEIADAIAYLDQLVAEVIAPAHPAAAIGVFGFSQGVALAARWAERGKVALATLALWGSTLPDEVDLSRLAERLQGVNVTLVAGESDPLLPAGAMDRALARLTDAGIRATLRDLAHHFTVANP